LDYGGSICRLLPKNIAASPIENMNKIKSVLDMVKGCLVFVWETFINVFRIIRSPGKSFMGIYGVSFYRNSAYLIANSGLSLFLGLVFNVLITRMYSASDVGYGSAIIAVLNFLGFIGTLGFGYYVVRYLPSADDHRWSHGGGRLFDLPKWNFMVGAETYVFAP
jgi:hypothetical protein